ncbi:MAG: SEC-C domain-containing protein [SAR324 cluster bacterium]|nr:SEC-C domain-containing protein [SAR324 cluster bacterium]
MAKLGRNAPCLCGSGKKFKKCCLSKVDPFLSSAAEKRNKHWSFREIELFSTTEIIKKLQIFGIAFEQKQFLQDVETYYSGEDIAKHWHETHSITAQGFDLDFIWMSIVVLWNRLAPNIPNSETAYDLIEHGYDLLKEKQNKSRSSKEMDACKVWLKAWDYLKPRFSKDLTSIEDAEKIIFNDMPSLCNMCQDLEMELHNAGIEDFVFIEKRIQFTQEFCQHFPNSSELTLHNMRRGEAESYFFLGRVEEGNQAFEKLIQDYPNNIWGYIGWADMYHWPLGKAYNRDYDRAEKIYKMALQVEVDDREDVLERLKDLEKSKSKE